ncbi:inorganic pyrophosphatase [Vairimorpha apis BRL 01]|uniref:inorganic diphosphatase n=1 Tax=Vairimorpha apis BRL 01 TaxID=1037528 RepID=T0M9Y5_9MICR|nr:inorganic pyrophosphatase [Vairimorpha apis BRL 01]
MSNTYSTHTIGSKYTFDYKVYILENKKIVSPFHSINLYQHEDTSIVTVVNEIPRFENAKFEISKDISLNPIKQDIKNEKLRFTKNMFPFKGYMWNYGAIPQTWEDKDQVCGYTGCRGDNDPLDVIDFSKIKKKLGKFIKLKFLDV